MKSNSVNKYELVVYGTRNNFEYEYLLLLEMSWVSIPEVKCYGSIGDKYAAFLAPSSGEIEAIRLTHFSGVVSCGTNNPSSLWGCQNEYFQQNEFMTFVTDSEKKIIFPSVQYRNDYTNGVRSTYKVAGADVKTTKSVILKSDPPRIVEKGEEFQIWYNVDRTNVHESGNDPNALHCILVSLKYC